jgi:hypothetical protein
MTLSGCAGDGEMGGCDRKSGAWTAMMIAAEAPRTAVSGFLRVPHAQAVPGTSPSSSQGITYPM